MRKVVVIERAEVESQSVTQTVGTNEANLTVSTAIRKDNNSENKQMSRSNVRFSILVYSISFLTTIQSICSILALASILLNPTSILVTVTNNVFNFFLVFKCCCFFLIFYFLNSNFKKKINSWLHFKIK